MKYCTAFEPSVTTHASYVQILMEVGLVGIDGLAGLLADTVRSQVLLALLGLIHILHGSRGVLQSVEAHLGSHASENGGGASPLMLSTFPMVVKPLMRTVSPT